MNADSKQWQQAIADNLASINWVAAPADIQKQSTEKQIGTLKAQQKTAKDDLNALAEKITGLQAKITSQSSKIDAETQMNTQIHELAHKQQELVTLTAKKKPITKS